MLFGWWCGFACGRRERGKKAQTHTHAKQQEEEEQEVRGTCTLFHQERRREKRKKKKRQACGTQDDNCLYLAHLFYPGDKLAAPLPMFLPHLLAGGHLKPLNPFLLHTTQKAVAMLRILSLWTMCWCRREKSLIAHPVLLHLEPVMRFLLEAICQHHTPQATTKKRKKKNADECTALSPFKQSHVPPPHLRQQFLVIHNTPCLSLRSYPIALS